MFDKLIERINAVMVKIGEIKNQGNTKDEKIKELEEMVESKNNEIEDLMAHNELVAEDMLDLMEEVEAIKNKVVDEDGLVELERLIEALEGMLDDER